MKAFKHFAAGLGFCLIASQAYSAFECSLNAVKAGKASADSTEVSLPVRLPDCTNIRVTAGEVVACVQDQRGRLICRTFRADERVVEQRFGVEGTARTWRAAIVDYLAGRVDQESAVSRGPEQRDYLPAGRVIFIDDRFAIDFNRIGLPDIDAIEFRRDITTGPLVLRIPAALVSTVDASQFAPGTSYWWNALGQNKVKASGRFFVVDAGTRRQAQAIADELKQQYPTDQAAQAMVFADWLREHGFDFDAAQVLIRAELFNAAGQ